MKTVCVLIGANLGRRPCYLAAAQQLGKELAKRGTTLIYGGSKLGLMGALADTVLQNNGKVIGVITKHLYENEAHQALTELHIVESMQERKKLMAELSEGFIALPGGLGTLEEFFEIWNASKLKIHNKTLGLLNTNDYFNKLIEFVNYSISEGFLREDNREWVKMSDDPSALLDMVIGENV